VGECAVIYTRVSTDVQGDGYSLQTQLASCRQYAAKCGYRVVGEYSDHYSGEALRRPQLSKLTEQVYLESIAVVVVHDLDRFTRNPSHLAILEMEIEQAGGRIEFVMGDNTDSPEGQLSKAIKAAIAQYENRQRAERSRRGRRGRVSAGLVRSFGERAPYGYAYTPGSGVFTVVEDEAAIVRWLFTQATEGASSHTLAANLSAAGRATPRGARKWHPSTIYRILRRPLYCGVWSEYIDGVLHTASVPEIIDATVWQQAQHRLDMPRYRSTARPFLLTGFLRCSCGAAWTGRTRSPTSAYYRCSSIMQRMQREACTMPGAIRADRLEEAVWSALVDLLQQTDWLEIALAQRQQEIAATRSAYDARIQTVASALDALAGRERSLLDALLDGKLTASSAANTQSELASERERLQAEMALCQETPLPVLPLIDRSALNRHIAQGLATLDFAQRRHILLLLEVRLTVERQDLVHLSVLDGLVTQPLTVVPLVHPCTPQQRTAYRPRKEVTL